MPLPRLIFITGKGGTGKSTLAAALALALARRRPTILADLDQRPSAARILGVRAEDRPSIQVHANLEVARLSPRAELERFIERIVPLKMISRRMLKSRTFGYVTAALPGLEAFLMLERLREMAGRAALEDHYVVIDGPATGGALELLSVAKGVKGIAPLGTLNSLASGVEAFLADPNYFGVILTLTPEDLALREAIEAACALAADLRVNRVAAILNGVAEALFDGGELAAAAGFKEHARLAKRRLDAARSAAKARRELERAGMKVIETPMLFTPELGRAQVRGLGERLEAAFFE